MMKNRLEGILWFVLLALAFAGCSSSIATMPKGAATPTLKGALKVDIVLSDSAIRASQTTFALGVPYHFVVKNEGHVAQEFLIIPSLEQRSTRNLDQLSLYHITASQLPPKATSSFEITFTRRRPSSTNRANPAWGCGGVKCRDPDGGRTSRLVTEHANQRQRGLP